MKKEKTLKIETSKTIDKEKTYSIGELQLIINCVPILITCPGVPFEIAQRLNRYKIFAEKFLKELDENLLLLRSRLTPETALENKKDEEKLLSEKRAFPTTLHKVYERNFKDRDINGEKIVNIPVNENDENGQQKHKKDIFLYRDVYFALVDIIIELDLD